MLEQTFSVEDERFGEIITVDLKPDGRDIAVTEENKTEYVKYVFILNLLQDDTDPSFL